MESELFNAIEDHDGHAQVIHAAIVRSNEISPIRIGFASWSSPKLAAKELRSCGFKKPFLRSSKDWVRSTLASNARAFAALAPHIELSMVYEGKVCKWYGYGQAQPSLSWEEARALGPIILSRLPKIFVVFQLGVEPAGFSDLLEGM